MATYAIGDIQGCFGTFEKLLERIGFAPGRDRLWLTGDLVNRGPRSLEMLRWAAGHDEAVVCVTGNHDLHLLGCAEGIRRQRPRDTIAEVLAAPDRARLLDWLRARPFTHREDGFFLVHAGLLPAWTLEETAGYGRELQAALAGPGYRETLAAIYSKSSLDWRPALEPPDRWRSLAAVFTRLRTCDPEGQPAYEYTGDLDAMPAGLAPWFRPPHRRDPGVTVLFGHWAALGFHREPGVIALDSGCVWGGVLTAIRLEDLAVFQEPYAG